MAKLKKNKVKATVTVEVETEVTAESKNAAYGFGGSHIRNVIPRMKILLPAKIKQSSEASAYIYKSEVEIL